MMKHGLLFRISKWVSESLAGGVVFVLNEAAFIWSVHSLGPLLTIIIFSTLYGAVALFLFSWWRREASSPSTIGRFTRWTAARAAALQKKYSRLIVASTFVALLVAAVFTGAFVTAVLLGLLGYQGRRAQVYVVLLTIFSVSVWALFYAGGLRLVFRHW